jgi:hypothetical protein
VARGVLVHGVEPIFRARETFAGAGVGVATKPIPIRRKS